MATISIEGMNFGQSTCDGPMHITQNGGELRVTGKSIHPLLPEVIGTNIRVTVQPDASGPVVLENLKTHEETNVEGKIGFRASDVIVQGEN